MPLVEHAFSEPLPARLYVDADLLINHLVSSQPHHSRCRAFMERLAAEGRTVLYVSSLTWLELAQAYSRENFRRQLPEAVQRRYQLQHWQRREVRGAYLSQMLASLDELLAQFRVVELSITPSIRLVATTYMGVYGLRSLDAVHLATAATENVADFASLDEVYWRVDDLDLWNDLIHGSRGTR